MSTCRSDDLFRVAAVACDFLSTRSLTATTNKIRNHFRSMSVLRPLAVVCTIDIRSFRTGQIGSVGVFQLGGGHGDLAVDKFLTVRASLKNLIVSFRSHGAAHIYHTAAVAANVGAAFGGVNVSTGSIDGTVDHNLGILQLCSGSGAGAASGCGIEHRCQLLMAREDVTATYSNLFLTVGVGFQFLGYPLILIHNINGLTISNV